MLDIKFDTQDREEREEISIVMKVLKDGREAVLKRNCPMKCRIISFKHQVISSSPDDWFCGFEEGQVFRHRTRIDEYGFLQVSDIFLENGGA